MYGATEATARIHYVPPERLAISRARSASPIPGGRLAFERDGQEVDAPGQVGELVYRGPNVMLGYASRAADLRAGGRLGADSNGRPRLP